MRYPLRYACLVAKTSVYLPADLLARWKASGLPLSEIIRRGLDAIAPEVHEIEEPLRRVIREELAVMSANAPERPPATDCPHPKARVIKGLCNACGTNISAGQ